jgi:hypothetical protein
MEEGLVLRRGAHEVVQLPGQLAQTWRPAHSSQRAPNVLCSSFRDQFTTAELNNGKLLYAVDGKR